MFPRSPSKTSLEKSPHERSSSTQDLDSPSEGLKQAPKSDGLLPIGDGGSRDGDVAAPSSPVKGLVKSLMSPHAKLDSDGAKSEMASDLLAKEVERDKDPMQRMKRTLDEQRTLQNSIAERIARGDTTLDKVMKDYNSVGFEYEFTGHNKPSMESHVSLAKSENFSKLFKLGFEIESDSGAVVEIGIPPMLVKKTSDRTADLNAIKEMHETFEGAMAAVRKEGNEGHYGIETLANTLNEKLGLSEVDKGAGFKKTDAASDLTLCEPTADKLSGGKIYSQMNISMTGQESGHFILRSQEHFKEKPNFAEKSILGDTLKELQGVNIDGLSPESQIHIQRALANTLAIPSLLAKEKLGNEHDMSSAVKELQSVWIKDSLPNILQTSGADKDALDRFASGQGGARAAMQEVMDTALTKAMVPVKEALTETMQKESTAQKRQILDVQKLTQGAAPSSSKELDAALQKIENPTVRLEATRQVTEIMTMMDETDDFTQTEKDNGGAGEALKRYETKVATLEKYLATEIAAVDKNVEHKYLGSIEDTVRSEIRGLLNSVNRPDLVGVDGSKFGKESFGTGTGVRKDTFIGRDASVKKADLSHSVVEIRSPDAMKFYFESGRT